MALPLAKHIFLWGGSSKVFSGVQHSGNLKVHQVSIRFFVINKQN